MAKKTIMIVDDEEVLLTLVKRLLEEEGFNVITTTSGRGCLERLKKTKPDLIIMDMMMPGMSGLDATEKIRENPKTKNLKIMFLTVVLKSEITLKKLKKLRPIDYIEKPFENNELVSRVKRILGH